MPGRHCQYPTLLLHAVFSAAVVCCCRASVDAVGTGCHDATPPRFNPCVHTHARQRCCSCCSCCSCSAARFGPPVRCRRCCCHAAHTARATVDTASRATPHTTHHTETHTTPPTHTAGPGRTLQKQRRTSRQGGSLCLPPRKWPSAASHRETAPWRPCLHPV